MHVCMIETALDHVEQIPNLNVDNRKLKALQVMNSGWFQKNSNNTNSAFVSEEPTCVPSSNKCKYIYIHIHIHNQWNIRTSYVCKMRKGYVVLYSKKSVWKNSWMKSGNIWRFRRFLLMPLPAISRNDKLSSWAEGRRQSLGGSDAPRLH